MNRSICYQPENFTLASTTPMEGTSISLLITLTISYTIIFIVGLVGNLITCIVISRNKCMHTATNFYLFNLAISDLILILYGIPQDLYNLWYPMSYPFNNLLCVIESILLETATNATVLTITSFTIERYIAICHPLRQYTMSKLSRAVKFMFFIWLIAILLALPQAMQFSVVIHVNTYTQSNDSIIDENNDNGINLASIIKNRDCKSLMHFKPMSSSLSTECTINSDFYAHVFALSGFMFFGVPMTAICIFYILIGRKLKNRCLLQSTPQRNTIIKRNAITAQNRVIRMLIAVAVTFFICWAPFHAQRLMAVYGSMSGIDSELFKMIFRILDYTSGVLYFLSTCINPLLYNIMSDKFRKAFKMTLKRHISNNLYDNRRFYVSANTRRSNRTTYHYHTTVNYVNNNNPH